MLTIYVRLQLPIEIIRTDFVLGYYVTEACRKLHWFNFKSSYPLMHAHALRTKNKEK